MAKYLAKIWKKKIFKQYLNHLYLIFFSLLYVFLIVNIVFSQRISSIYLGVIAENKKSVVNFLTYIKNTPEFPTFFNINKNIYGNLLADEVFKREKKREKTIQLLEKTLTINLNSRDLLYNLYKLYEEKGDKIKACYYYQKATQIDPQLKNL